MGLPAPTLLKAKLSKTKGKTRILCLALEEMALGKTELNKESNSD